jgi:hypothetical protein
MMALLESMKSAWNILDTLLRKTKPADNVCNMEVAMEILIYENKAISGIWLI